MKKIKKIGCLDNTAVNYDVTAEIACERCCIPTDNENNIKNIFDFLLYGEVNQNKVIDYSKYAVKSLDGQPLFTLPSLAKSFALQTGCTGYHEHTFQKRKLYMACESHEIATEENELKPTCEDYIESITPTGEIKWSRATQPRQQMLCCNEKQKDGYKWDYINRICKIPNEKSTEIGNHQIVGYVENVPVWYTQGAALEYSDIIKCDGYHTYNMYGTTGYVACKNLETIVEVVGNLECKQTRKMMDGTLAFTKLSPTNIRKYGEACCLEHSYKGYLWNGNGCVKNEMELTWSCINNLTTEIYNGTGEHKTFKECYTFCEDNKK
tara:strand:- start:10144 stop:11112 length:969 start_codon:yes stop_codon:yes gene_type:complete